MSEKEKGEKGGSKTEDLWEDMNTQRQGKRDGGTPDYEKGQSSPISQEEYKEPGWK